MLSLSHAPIRLRGFSIRLAMGFNVRKADWRNSAGILPLESTNLSTSK